MVQSKYVEDLLFVSTGKGFFFWKTPRIHTKVKCEFHY